MTPTVVVSRDASSLAHAAADRLVTALVEAQALRGSAAVVLAGGGVAVATLAAVAASPRRTDVDWSCVDVWWGDERYVAADNPERNELQARQALLDHVDVDPVRVHPMGALGGPDGDDVDAAAARYAAELAAAAPHGSGLPALDLVLLGMGVEGHTASIYPESPAAHDERVAVGVHGCPKPPPTRITLGFSALCAAQEVWVLAAGAEKAGAVALGLSGAGRVQVPVAGAVGRRQTLWLLDEAAAGDLPPTLRRL
jgi:6-phosphogluconolactonase